MRVARCTVERLMRQHKMKGVTRGSKWMFTTIQDESLGASADLVERDFEPTAPNRFWVADVTFVRALVGFVYAAFVVDAFSRRIVGWQISDRVDTRLVLDALHLARSERDVGGGLVHHSDRGSTYLFIAYSRVLLDAGVAVSVGSKGDALDNALSESITGLYKSEVMDHLGPWKGVTDVLLETMSWVSWFNNDRSYERLGYMSPAAYETKYYRAGQAAA